ncbi:hypothetical protein, partial [Thermoanaerobacterium thermosaccharolyticum]|uniref:hypothetical protein n=1 Tax=Thermoanaerobacterium thermosaccharolyticum TaxID=1517 RepID=UPI001C5FFAF6
ESSAARGLYTTKQISREKRQIWCRDHTLKSGKTAWRTKACPILTLQYNNATSYLKSKHKGRKIKDVAACAMYLI